MGQNDFISFKRVLVRIRSQPRYVQTLPAVFRLVYRYLGQFCTGILQYYLVFHFLFYFFIKTLPPSPDMA